jgi:multidrug resistance efflux pump
MLEIMLCSLVTILPDYLFRRYYQGKRIGKEITLYSVWFELRWGITGCLVLAVGLITVVFYNHPSTTNVTLFFRTIPIISEATGRVAEVFVDFNGTVEKGAPIFRLDSSVQEAAVETARRRIAEVEADMEVAQADILKTEGQLQEAQGSYQMALDELETKMELQKRNPGIVAQREIEKLQVAVEGRKGAIASATAAGQTVKARISALLPAQRASAVAALAQAEAELAKTVVRAGVNGRVEQFALRVGDIVTPIMRAAGVLIPEGAGQRTLQAGFGQIEAQIIRPGMIAEVTCVSKPFTIIPMVVTDVQDYIAAGQFRGGDQLIDPQQIARPGTLLVHLEPLYKGGLVGVTPGSSCIANAYSNNHDIIVSKDTSTMRGIALHAVDALGLVHALILRIQALVLPFKVLVFSGGH